MANTFNFRYKEKYHSNTCVVKYFFGTKFFIWKALHLHQSCNQVFRDLNSKIAKFKMGTLSEDDLFYRVAQHCSKARVIFATVEVLFESEDFCAIMEFDQRQLITGRNNPNCLNLSAKQYIPGWLKCVTSNKALQSIISPPADKTTTEAPDIKPALKEISVAPKLATADTGSFDPADILDKIRHFDGQS